MEPNPFCDNDDDEDDDYEYDVDVYGENRMRMWKILRIMWPTHNRCMTNDA